MTRPDPELVRLLAEAASRPIGLRVRTTTVHRLRQQLYVARRAGGFSHLSVVEPPARFPGELWIVRKDRGDEARAQSPP